MKNVINNPNYRARRHSSTILVSQSFQKTIKLGILSCAVEKNISFRETNNDIAAN